MGNATLAIFLITTIFLTSLARFIPYVKTADAAEGKKKITTLKNSIVSGRKEVVSNEKPEPPKLIDKPLISRFENRNVSIDYIFHKEPRVRLKSGSMELETTMLEAEGLGKVNPKEAVKEDGVYYYKEILPDMDLKFTPTPTKLTEEVILKKYHDFNSISYDLNTIDLDFIQEDNELYFYKEGSSDHSDEQWIFVIRAPFMYEQSNIDNKSYELTYVVEKKTVG